MRLHTLTLFLFASTIAQLSYAALRKPSRPVKLPPISEHKLSTNCSSTIIPRISKVATRKLYTCPQPDLIMPALWKATTSFFGSIDTQPAKFRHSQEYTVTDDYNNSITIYEPDGHGTFSMKLAIGTCIEQQFLKLDNNALAYIHELGVNYFDNIRKGTKNPANIRLSAEQLAVHNKLPSFIKINLDNHYVLLHHLPDSHSKSTSNSSK